MARNESPITTRRMCSLPRVPARVLSPDLSPKRTQAIRETEYQWVNGTVLHYYFFDRPDDGTKVLLQDGTTEWRSWVGEEAQRRVVRDAFAKWKSLGIGLRFEEVAAREEAELRIGFMRDDGSWSYIGKYATKIGSAERTMNFGWNLLDDFDTALHEIGHALAMKHEHQNPKSGIVWDEAAVYQTFKGEPNFWEAQKIHDNIIRKLEIGAINGSTWDPDSVMHYEFSAGLILEPEGYRDGLKPRGGLSDHDIAWTRSFYPALSDAELPELRAGRSEPLPTTNGEQRDFVLRPDATRTYQMRTFGTCDSTLVLFEDDGGKLRYRTADDDSGDDRNASLSVKLFTGRSYVLRARMNYTDTSSPPTLMMW
ncbi:MAG TPA: M12 family metallopeptidase [Longimicrobium sp.]|nr:M12 family metallopeptidase [Longimicrobium sp.]